MTEPRKAERALASSSHAANLIKAGVALVIVVLKFTACDPDVDLKGACKLVVLDGCREPTQFEVLDCARNPLMPDEFGGYELPAGCGKLELWAPPHEGRPRRLVRTRAVQCLGPEAEIVADGTRCNDAHTND